MIPRLSLLLLVGGGLLLAGATAFIIADPLGSAPSDAQQTESTDATPVIASDWLQGVFQETDLGIAEGELLTDTDKDGLPDVVENFVYGSDPTNWTTTGEMIPDGWLAGHGYDPTGPGTASRSAATPDPADLPEAYGGVWPHAWTLKDVYDWGRPSDWDEESQGPYQNGIDPREVSYDADGIPYAWLHHHGFLPKDAVPATESVQLSDDDFTVMDDYVHGTDPHLADTDGDGLKDSAEADGTYKSDPTRFSTGGTGIADGWLVLYALDPTDPWVGSQQVTGKGMTVQETWDYNLREYGLESAVGGAGLSATALSTLGNGIPDGWLIAHGQDPLDPAVPDKVVQNASDFDHVYNLTDAPDGLDVLPDLVMTVKDHYTYGRPSGWDEATDGAWWNSLDITDTDTDGDGLPDAIEIRGWYIPVMTSAGPDPAQEWRFVTSDPMHHDTDSDGLTDGQEYFGRVPHPHDDLHDDLLVTFRPSDPRNSDTTFSGLSDYEKVIGRGQWTVIDGTTIEDLPVPGASSTFSPQSVVRPLLDPSRRDTAGDHLSDGEELAYWTDYAARIEDGDYTARFSGSGCTDAGLTADLVGPFGDADADTIPNVVDPDADNDTLLNGWEIRPGLYKFSSYPEPPQGVTRPQTDPANRDTDCDDLPDYWEVQYALHEDGAWTLDPSNENSDGDEEGVLDGDENADGDVVIWHRYKNGVRQQPQEFEFTNYLEFDSETDPNKKDQDGDGVTEGWVYFWGQVYPTKILSNNDVGDVAPTSDDIIAIQEQQPGLLSLKGPRGDPGNVGYQTKDLDEHGGEIDYRRILKGVTSTSSISFEDGEGLEDPDSLESDDNPQTTNVYEDGRIASISMGVIAGKYIHTYAQDQEHGLNPYLADTDGDGMPDAWEALYSRGCGGDLDPAVPDAFKTPNQAILTNGDTYSYSKDQTTTDGRTVWTDPCMEDTDLDGVSDVSEFRLGSEPTDPFDVTDPEKDVDTDNDGRDDGDELFAGTDPTDADSDNDGLLDHTNQSVTLASAEAEELLASFIGVAYKDNGDGTRWFYGEATYGTHASDRHSLLDKEPAGVPDGWLTTYSWGSSEISGNENTLIEAYGCNRPSWWVEETMGVWWWGMDASGSPPFDCTDTDLDRDGLDDRNGEDPIPAASPTLDVREHPLDATGQTTLATAQAWGDCAGDPETCKDEWASRLAPALLQAPVNLTIDGPPSPIYKGVPFNVTGHVCIPLDDGSCRPVANRTVTIQLDDEVAQERSLGVNITDAEGDFTISSCICAERSFTIPHNGTTVHSRQTEGTVVEWSIPTEDIHVGDLGDHQIMARVYATNARLNEPHEGHPHHIDVEGYHATRSSTTTPVDVIVHSATGLVLDAPTDVAWSDDSRSLRAEVTLTDATDAPLPRQSVWLEVEYEDGRFDNTTMFLTNSKGEATKIISINDGVVGDLSIRAHFSGTDNLSASESDGLVATLQRPLNLDLAIIDPPGAEVPSGGSVKVQVEATSQDMGVEGVDVILSFGGVEVTVVTGPGGLSDEVELSTGSIASGKVFVNARVNNTSEWAGAVDSEEVQIVSQPIINLAGPSNAVWEGTIEMSGNLRFNDGTALHGRLVHFTVDGHEVLSTTTDEDGDFFADVPMECSPGKSCNAGRWTVIARFDGDADERIRSAQASKEVSITVPTVVTVEDQNTSRGDSIEFTGRLRDKTGTELHGERVWMEVDGERTLYTITDASGAFHASWDVPGNISYGPHVLKAAFGGSEDRIYGASSSLADLLVTTSTHIDLKPIGDVPRGNTTLEGSLVTREGDPMAQTPVHFSINGVTVGQTVTDTNGNYTHVVTVSNNIQPGPLVIDASYKGNNVYGASHNTTQATLTVQPELVIHAPSTVGRGNDGVFRATLVDDLGNRVLGEKVRFEALDEAFVMDTGANGVASFRLPVPSDEPLGQKTVAFQFDGATGYLPVDAIAKVVIKEGSRLEIINMPDSIATDAPAKVTVRLTDLHGNPIPDQIITVRFEGDPLATVMRTDEEGYANGALPAPSSGTGRLLLGYQGDSVYGPTVLDSEPLSIDSVQTTTTTTAPQTRSWVVPVVFASIGLAAIAAAIVAWRRVRSNPDLLLLHTLEDAKKSIKTSGVTWEEAVRNAYHHLVEHTSLHGHEVVDSESAREFMQSLAAVAPIPPKAAVELTHLFERATYSDGDGDGKETDAAMQSLDHIIAAIEEFLFSPAARRSHR